MPKMRSEKVSEAHRVANNRYDAKTYERFTMALRIQEDADIIRDIRDAKKNGVTMRGWIRGLYDNAKSK